MLVAAVSCGSANAPESATVGTQTDLESLLGPTNPATGSSIKIGLVGDGKTMGIDQTPMEDAFKATVQYANERLGGLNGHKIEVDFCVTNNTPSDATTCGVQMVNDGVAAVLVPVSAQDGAIYKAIAESGIPYIGFAAGSPDVILGANAFLLVNPVAALAAPAKIAKDDGLEKAGIILVDVPAATGSIDALVQPIYRKAGVDLELVKVSPQTADMTPQIQQALSGGVNQFLVLGGDSFNAQAIKTLKDLGFDGKILLATAPSKAIADVVPGGLQGVLYISTATTDPNDREVQRFDAVMKTYMRDNEPNAQSAWSYSLVTALLDALRGNESAIDAASVRSAFGAMPKALPVPLGGGLTYQCGAKVVSFLSSVCTKNTLLTTLDAEGNGGTYEQLDLTEYMTMG